LSKPAEEIADCYATEGHIVFKRVATGLVNSLLLLCNLVGPGLCPCPPRAVRHG
jgi:hypothetical protein